MPPGAAALRDVRGATAGAALGSLARRGQSFGDIGTYLSRLRHPCPARFRFVRHLIHATHCPVEGSGGRCEVKLVLGVERLLIRYLIAQRTEYGTACVRFYCL